MEEKINLILTEIQKINTRIESVENEVKKANSRLDTMEGKFNTIEGEFDNLGTVTGVILELAKKTDEKVSRIEKKLDRHEAILKTQAAKNREVEIRLEHLEEGLLPETTGKRIM